MSLECEVRPFKPDEWHVYKELRLRALSESPDAYCGTLNEESRRPQEEWELRVEKAQDRRSSLPIFALCDSKPVGLAWGRIERSEPEVAHVFQVWVDPHYRTRGIGRRLMDELVAWARENGARWVELGVTERDSPAVRLYERLGFRPYGEPLPLRDGSSLMMRNLRLAIDATG